MQSIFFDGQNSFLTGAYCSVAAVTECVRNSNLKSKIANKTNGYFFEGSHPARANVT
jgi:hypothetical protein